MQRSAQKPKKISIGFSSLLVLVGKTKNNCQRDVENDRKDDENSHKSYLRFFFLFFTLLIVRSYMSHKMDYIYYKVSHSDMRGVFRARKAR